MESTNFKFVEKEVCTWRSTQVTNGKASVFCQSKPARCREMWTCLWKRSLETSWCQSQLWLDVIPWWWTNPTSTSLHTAEVKVEWQLTSPFDPTADMEGDQEGGQEYAWNQELCFYQQHFVWGALWYMDVYYGCIWCTDIDWWISEYFLNVSTE